MTSPGSSPPRQGRVAIVTGASSGLGQAIAVMFARRGASVTLCGRDEARLHVTFDMCQEVSRGHGGRFLEVIGDVSESAARKNIIEQTVETFGRLDVLVACAGVNSPHSGVNTATEESFDTVVNTNVKAVFFLIQEALPALAQRGGSVVVVSSLSSLMASSPNIVYPISKAAVDHMVRCLAVDLGPSNIRVNAVNPGFVPTRIRRDFAQTEDEENQHVMKVVQTEVSKQPLGDVGVTAEGVAEAVSFLASDAASFVTGHCLPVDAGRGFMGAFDSSNKR